MTAAGSLRVLLIEDNELDARTMVKNLGANAETGFHVTRVGDLASAIELLDGRQSDHRQLVAEQLDPRRLDGSAFEGGAFDCVLLDLSLPDSEGLMSVEVLAERAPTCPIVVLTGLDDPSTAVEAVERGAQDYLSKQDADRDTVARSIRYAVARFHSELALRSATDQLSLLRDRERIARDLHDTVIQQLFATGIGLQSVVASMEEGKAHDRVLEAVGAIDSAIRQLREAIFGLNVVPEGVALAEVVNGLVDEKREALGLTPIVEVGAIPEDLSPVVKREAVQIVSEALSNVAKHAEATVCKVVIEADEGELVVTVTDNGRGIPRPNRQQESGLTGNGLTNMAQRAADLAGRFQIGLGPGGGTRIEWRVPLGRPVEEPMGTGR
ncbi:MAG: ATP-binding protein [Acidimicrobiales bacterium]